MLKESRAARCAAGLSLVGMVWLGSVGVVADRAMAKERLAAGEHKLTVSASQLEGFDALDLQRRKFGAFIWLGGLSLASKSPFWGGVSSLALRGPNAYLSLSDAGYWYGFTLVADKVGKPLDIRDVRIGHLGDDAGKPFKKKKLWDSEALTLVRGADQQGLHVRVAFERANRIRSYALTKTGISARGVGHPAPKAMRKLKHNKGVEALVQVPEGHAQAGALLAIAERGRKGDRDRLQGWLLRDGQPARAFWIKRHKRFDITDAAFLPNRDLLILERHFSFSAGISMQVRLIKADTIKPDALLDGKVLVSAPNTYLIDNMEGLSVQPVGDGSGDVFVTLVSDDNFSFLQRTLLHRFRYTPEMK